MVVDPGAADDAVASRSSGGTPPPPGDRDLVARARTDADAFAELYRRHVHDVHAYITRRCGSPTLADDITAAAFERALRNLDGFEWRDAGFRGWLFRIAGNELVDHHRRIGAERRRDVRLGARRTESADDPADLVTQAGDDATAARLRTALARIAPRYQEAVALRHLSGLDPGEAARVMNVSKPTYAVLLHRAMKALERELEAGS